jgi:hypothetical protein
MRSSSSRSLNMERGGYCRRRLYVNGEVLNNDNEWKDAEYGDNDNRK